MNGAKIMKLLIFTALIVAGTLGAPLHAQIDGSNAGGGAETTVFAHDDSATDSSGQEDDDELVDEGSAVEEEEESSALDKPEVKYISIRRY